MLRRKKTLLILSPVLLVMLTLFFFSVGCKKDKPATADPGYSYFPNEIGHYCIYNVDSTVYDDFNHDTVYYNYQIKEVVESYFTDNQGRQAMRIERYKRANDTLPWVISRVWSFVQTNSEAEKDEENQRFIRLSFVPREGKKWDGNAYNTIGEWDYEYSEVDKPYMMNAMIFDSTLLVTQKLDTNLLTYKIYKERYARHVGMIEKNVIDVYDNTLVSNVSVLNRIYGGVIYNIKLIDWGPR